MKILIATFGGMGDVLPYVALGRGLLSRGHSVTLCANSRFEEMARRYGLDYAYMNNGFSELIESAAGRQAFEDMASWWGTIKTMAKMARQIGPLQRRTLDDAWAAARQTEPEVILYHSKLVAAIHFADKVGARAIAAPLFPQWIPTADFPAVGFPALALGRGYNRLTYRIVARLTRMIAGRYIRRWRRANDLPPAPYGADPMRDPSGQPIPMIHAYSAHLVPTPADWPPHATTCGTWFLDQWQDWQPSPELLDFLAAGDPPVYVGFGSMAGRQPQRLAKLVPEALKQAGARGILASGWGGLEAESLPDYILKLDHAPHDWLFPQMAAVVHHGGSGTTAAGLRAGRPTIVCPFFGDQPFWGARVQALGVGSQPIPQKKLTAEGLATALREVLEDPSFAQRAAALGRKINHEDGIGQAIDSIESLAAGGVPTQP